MRRNQRIRPFPAFCLRLEAHTGKPRGEGGICARESTADCPLQALPAVLAVTLKEVGEQALQSQTTSVFAQESAGFLGKPWGPEPVPQEGLLLAVTCLGREEA